MDRAYYNDTDAAVCAWLRELIAAGLIAAGDVDERSIAEVQPSDLAGYTQCHFFAGIGGWSYALRLAGWADDRPVWTGSCPCQPFSAAGSRRGEADSRHLWPEFRRLIAECAPSVVLGEQVASKAGRGWLARVRTDLEDLGFAVGAADLCAASCGAPHIRQRLFWVADAGRSERGPGQSRDERDRSGVGRQEASGGARIHREADWLADAERDGRQSDERRARAGEKPIAQDRSAADRGLAHTSSARSGRDAGTIPCAEGQGQGQGSESGGEFDQPQYGRTPWSVFERIGRRRIERGTQPLVTRLPAGVVRGGDTRVALDPQNSAEGRLMRLRGYGNAIVPQVAAEFVAAYLGAQSPEAQSASPLLSAG